MRWGIARLLILFLVFVEITAPGTAGVLSGYAKRVWRAQDGLPEQIVQAFAQTPDGYLWIGTTGGLLRFDGTGFLVYDRRNTPQLSENSIFCLLAARDGTLWIGTEGGGLLEYRSGRFRSYGAIDGLTNGFVRALYQDRLGQLWVGTDNGLFQFRQGRFEAYAPVNELPEPAVHAVIEDRTGALWVGGSRLLRIVGNKVREFQIGPPGSQISVKSILETRDGTIWAGSVYGLHRLVRGRSSFEDAKDVMGTVRILRETSDGALWAGTIGQGIFECRQGLCTQLTGPSALPSRTVLNIFEDSERNLWFGTQSGMLRLTKSPFDTVPLPDNSDSDFGTVSLDTDGSLWVASAHLYRVKENVARLVDFPWLRGTAKVRNVFRDRSGALWIGTDGSGVVRLDHGKVSRMSTSDGLSNNFIRAFMESHDGSIWIATDGGISHYVRGRGLETYQVSNGLCYFSTRALLEDRNHDVWIGTDHGVSHFQHGVFVTDPITTELSQDKVWTIHEDTQGGLWFGTRDNGLFRWKAQHLSHVTTGQGLASNSIYQILEGSDGSLWLSGPNGISRVDRKALDQVADQPAGHVDSVAYDVSGEMEPTQIFGGRQPAGVLGRHGDVWFPSTRGPIHIVPKHESQSAAPALLIDSVVVDGRQVPSGAPIRLSPNTGRIKISFAPLLLRSQEGMRFRYKLDGFEKSWSEASSRRSADYTNLPPGNYAFEVEAFDVNEPKTISRAVVPIVQQPHFYATVWFYAFCCLLVATVVWAAHGIRLRQMRMRFQGVLEERSRLAREMHDTVIQGCASVSALLEALSSLDPASGGAQSELLAVARTQARATIDEARDVVWNLRKGHASAEDLVLQLGGMIDRMRQESGIEISYTVSGRPFEINQTVAHELAMATREAVSNAVRHSEAALIDVTVSFQKDDFMIEVQDTGIGFDPKLTHLGGDRHYGLVGIAERMRRIGGRFTLNSARGTGTHLKLEAPRKATAVETVAAGITE